MRVETNARLVRRNRQIAQYLFFFSFGVLVLGLFLTNQQTVAADETDLLLLSLVPMAVVILAFLTTMASVRMTNLWVRQPRPENALRDGLKGLSNRSVLYNYYHGPARHVLISPQGVYAITTRFQDGAFTNHGSRWTTRRSVPGRIIGAFRFDNIGNPTEDAIRSAEHVKALLAPIAPDVPVYPLIVFTDPRVRLEIIDPAVPVLHAQDKLEPSLRAYMRDVSKQKRPSLTPQQIEAFEEATLPRAS